MEITDTASDVALSTPGLRAQLNIDLAGVRSSESLRLIVAAQLRRLGKQKRLIVAAPTPQTNPDPAPIKAMVNAHRWFNMLKDGVLESISDLARVEHVQRSYPTRIIPLAFLAPT